jgi:alkyl hydroperoxide reductase subunit AhpC
LRYATQLLENPVQIHVLTIFLANVDEKGIAFTIRSVFIIDPKKTIRLILSYPASTGR